MSIALPAAADEDDRILFDFSKPDAAQAWQPVNDGVMGGVSDGRFKITDQGTMEFFGRLSLENNGGFASVRSRCSNLGLNPDDSLLIRLRGDGREYLLNLYVPALQIAHSYRAAIPTKAGEWIEVRIPVKDCYATSFGRRLPNAGPVESPNVNSFGFTLSDKKAGPFKLKVARVKVVRMEPTASPVKSPERGMEYQPCQPRKGSNQMRSSRSTKPPSGGSRWFMQLGLRWDSRPDQGGICRSAIRRVYEEGVGADGRGDLHLARLSPTRPQEAAELGPRQDRRTPG